MTKKSSIVILGVVISMLLLTILYFSFFRASKVLSEAMKAVSPETSVLVEVKDYYNFSETLREDTEFWPALTKSAWFSNYDHQLANLDSVFKAIPELNTLIKRHSLLVAFNSVGKSSIEPVYIIETEDLTSEAAMHQFIEEAFSELGTIKSKDYQNSEIKTLKFAGAQAEHLSYAFYKGLLIASPSELLVEKSIRQVDNSESITQESDFKKVFKTAGNHVDFNIYIQYKTFANSFEKFVHPDQQKNFKNLMYFADWSEWDVNIEKQSVMLNGFTQSNDSSNNYLNIFKKQSPGSLDVSEVLPTSSAVILSLHLSDLELFMANQEEYLQNKGQKDNHKSWFNKLKKQYDFDLEKALLEITEQEISLVYTKINSLDLSQNTFFIVETNGENQTLEVLMPLYDVWASQRGVSFDQFTYEYNVTLDKQQTIYKFPKSNLAEHWLGRMFGHAKTNFYTFIDDYMVFGNTIKDLKGFIDENERKAVLENDTYFNQLQSEISSESNLFFYANITASKDLVQKCINKELASVYNNSFASLKKLQAFVMQVNTNEDMLYSNLLLNYDPNITEKPRTIWESLLDTSLYIKPEIVVNHRSNKKEIFVQDLYNTIYLIDRNGKVLWKQKLSQKIISKVYQVDVYKNNKLQYLFNTKDKIFIIDRNGNNIEHFPVNLRANATAGISVFDYDKSRDYRFFIPCENKKIYAYDVEGKILPGWTFGETEALVNTEVQHFRIGDSDYILTADKNRVYILNRRGEEKIMPKQNIRKSIRNPFFLVYKDELPYFSGTFANGDIFMINLAGNVFLKEGLPMSENHHMLMANLNHNQLFDVIYTDKGELKVLYDLKKTFNYDFDSEISKPIFFEFSSEVKKIGVTDYSNQKLYLFNHDGTIYKNFPLKGSTMFSISLLNNIGPKFNLISGSVDGFLYNYQVP